MKLKLVTKRKHAEALLIHHGGSVTYHAGGPGTSVTAHINNVGDGDGVSLVSAVNDAIEEHRKRTKSVKKAAAGTNGGPKPEKEQGTQN